MATSTSTDGKTDSTPAPITTWNKDMGKDGSFQRKASSIRNKITADGSSGFKAEPKRYHLYVSYACPWAHRTLIMRKLKGLEDVISYNVVDWHLGDGGWKFTDQKPGCTKDPYHDFEFLRQVYKLSDPSYEGSITVPVLYDTKTQKIVNNESSEIIRMLNTEFNAFCRTKEQAALDFYPPQLQKQIDEVNEWVYNTVNNGVYKAGFAKAQQPYEDAFDALFASLDRLEGILSKQRYLVGSQLTEADIRLFTTLVRFDPVYVGHFKCNLRRLVDYPNLFRFTCDIYQTAGIADTVNMLHIKNHYMGSHKTINPYGIIPKGPLIDYTQPHGRDRQFGSSNQ